MSGLMSAVTIFDSPKDFPGVSVARRFTIKGGRVFATADYQIGPDAASLRGWAQSQVSKFNKSDPYPIPRMENDHVSVVETWV